MDTGITTATENDGFISLSELNKFNIDDHMRELHRQITENLHQVYCIKNKDYGNSVLDTFIEFGPVSMLTRIKDKYNRLKTLSIENKGKGKVIDESIIDTCYDLANYSIILGILLEVERDGLI